MSMSIIEVGTIFAPKLMTSFKEKIEPPVFQILQFLHNRSLKMAHLAGELAHQTSFVLFLGLLVALVASTTEFDCSNETSSFICTGIPLMTTITFSNNKKLLQPLFLSAQTRNHAKTSRFTARNLSKTPVF